MFDKTLIFPETPDQEICLPYDSPSRKEEDCGHIHNLQTRILHMATTNGYDRGGVQGHLQLTHKGTPTLLSQALHQSDLEHAITQQANLLMLYFQER